MFYLPGTAYAEGFKPKSISAKESHQLIVKNTCSIHLSFGSYGSGTPLKVIKKISLYLKELTGIKKSYTWSWGLEGEYDYCLVFEEENRTSKVFDDLKKLIPEYSKNGYTKLKSKNGRTWATTWPK
jgi:hypothetical protein